MTEDLFPRSGVRLLFEQEESGDDVRYAVKAFMADGTTHAGSGSLAPGSELIELSGLDDAPEWVATLAQRFLRQIAAGQRGVDEPRWPRRVLRWRAAP